MMIITKNTRWITSYEIMNEYDVTMTISQYKNGKLARSLTYIIPIEFYDDVRNTFLALSKKYKDRYVVIDASKSLDEVVETTYKIIKEKLDGLR